MNTLLSGKQICILIEQLPLPTLPPRRITAAVPLESPMQVSALQAPNPRRRPACTERETVSKSMREVGRGWGEGGSD